MRCALTVFKNIGLFAALMAFVLALGAVLFAAAYGTAWIFGWTETLGPAMAISFAYGIIAGGVFAGIEECRRSY